MPIKFKKIFYSFLFLLPLKVMADFNADNTSFKAHDVREIKINVDKSRIQFRPSFDDNIKIQRYRISNFDGSIILKNGILTIKSVNPSQGGFEANYVIDLPKKVKVNLTGGYINFNSKTSFSSLSISSGVLKGDIKNPNCSIKLNYGSGSVDVCYGEINDKVIDAVFNTGNGSLELQLTPALKINYKFNAPPSFKPNINSDFPLTTINPNINIDFTTGTGSFCVTKID